MVAGCKHNPFGWRGDWPPAAILQTRIASSTFPGCQRRTHLELSVGTGREVGWEAERMRSQHFRGNVFVANLPPEFSDEQLAEAFDSYGIVLSASIARDPATGKRLRYGFVDIATERAAKLAVESMNGAQVDG